MSVDPVNLAAASGPARSQSGTARKPSSSDYDPGKPGFAQTLAEHSQAKQPTSARADKGQAQPAKAQRTNGDPPATDATGQRPQSPPEPATEGKGEGKGEASAPQARAAAGTQARPAKTDGHAPATAPADADGAQTAVGAVRIVDANANAITGTGQAVKTAKAAAANESPIDDGHALHAARDKATARDKDSLADQKTPQPLIGLIDPAPLAQNLRIAGQGKGQSDETQLKRAGLERLPAGSALQARTRGARAGVEPQLQRTDLTSALAQTEGGASAQDADSIGFARRMQRAMTLAADGAGGRSQSQDTSTTNAALNGLTSAAHVASSTAASAASPAAAAAPAGAVFTAALDAPLGSDAWSQAVTRQSLRLSHSDGGRAELTLYPRDLGQLQVSLKMGEQAQLHFSSPHAHVRAAVESALPQLRHAFADSGIALGDTSVSDQRPQQNFSDQRRRPASAGPVAAVTGLGDAGMSVAAPSVPVIGRSLAGGIDIFA